MMSLYRLVFKTKKQMVIHRTMHGFLISSTTIHHYVDHTNFTHHTLGDSLPNCFVSAVTDVMATFYLLQEVSFIPLSTAYV